jgi:hypothetical protein
MCRAEGADESEKNVAALAAAQKIGEDRARYFLTCLAACEAITLTDKTKL